VSISLRPQHDPGTDLDVLSDPTRLALVKTPVEIPLAADANAFDALHGPPATGDRSSMLTVLEVSRGFRRQGVTVRWMVPLLPSLVYRLEALFSLARDEGVEPVLTEAPLDLMEEDRAFAADFITYRLLEEDRHLYSADRIKVYEALRDTLAGGRPPAAVPGRTRFGRFVEKAIETQGVMADGSLAAAEWIRGRVTDLLRARPLVNAGQRFEKVLLIGAYGGEHIGDAAILGGVLLRLNRSYGTTEATVMSQRPVHTRHLLSMLDTPFKIDVRAYEHANIRERIPHVDAVVFGGGPLTDIPKQLVRHLYAVALGRRSGKPFIAEGVGPGPFRRRLSAWTARRIIRLADRISIRTSEGVHSQLMKGLSPTVGGDPAFDYLATRDAPLTRLPERDEQAIERLLENTAGRVVVGINLRPIRHMFTVGASPATRAEFTRTVEARFYEHLAEGLRQFQRASSVPPCFIFVPMNAIQFGMSDLRSAYRLQRLLRGDVDLRVWEGDASLDGVVAICRRLDIAICMRFHAAVFALSQHRHVIGIDYRVGAPDKVRALLDDVGQSENCTRIDKMTAQWLTTSLLVTSAKTDLG
jgi:polysaccharide pyruvyl transferase WcaK-like protein